MMVETIVATRSAQTQAVAHKSSLLRPINRPTKRRTPWDTLDISLMMEGVLDAFASEFYGCPFDELKDGQAKRITGAIAAHCIELGRACGPIPYELTQKGKAAAAGGES